MHPHPQEDDMGIRETINKRQRTTAGIVIAVIVVALGLAIWSQRSPADMRADKAYYADETGANLFVDDIDRAYPFDHNGKPAYRAYVYQGADGKQFVSYIARYNDAARAKLESLMSKKGDPTTAGELAQARGSGIEVKKPGDAKWVPLFSTQGETIASHPTLADGRTAQMVMP
jgi:hypothetical protein